MASLWGAFTKWVIGNAIWDLTTAKISLGIAMLTGALGYFEKLPWSIILVLAMAGFIGAHYIIKIIYDYSSRSATIMAVQTGWTSREKTMAVLLGMSLVFAGYGLYSQSQKGKSPTPAIQSTSTDRSILLRVRNETFRNQDVVVDGKMFIDCTFINVTFVHNGGRTELIAPHMEGEVLVHTSDVRLAEFVIFLKTLGVFRKDFRFYQDGKPMEG